MTLESKDWKKIRKLLSQQEINDLEAMDRDALMKVISECEGNVLEQERLRDEDEELQTAKENVKALNAGYREAIAVQSAKRRAARYMLESKGAA